MKRFFDAELETLRSDLFRMGDLVVTQLRNVLKAYAETDTTLANEVIEGDNEIDELEVRIDEEAISYISLRSPIATELRVIVTGMKASHELERAADEITKIARRVRHLNTEIPLKVTGDIVGMGEMTVLMLREALDCLIQGNEEKALAVCHRDAEVDRQNRALHEELTQLMTETPDTVSRAVDLMFISKALERVADHATNIAEDTIYLFKGKDVRHSQDVKKSPPAAEASAG